jgi:endonuclease/exonuclease/phosphatase family metal-dependent hydrolase
VRRRSRGVPVGTFDEAVDRWVDVDTHVDEAGAGQRAGLTLTTFNIWFNEYHAERRYRAIVELLSRNMPDVMVYQEVTPEALAVFLAQPWVRERYRRAEVTGDGVGNYGLLMLSRLPVERVRYTRLPTRLDRGFLVAELTVNHRPVVVAAVHLESGKAASRLRSRQLGRIFRALRGAETAFVLGDFNMRDGENGSIGAPYRDVWPTLRPHDDGFTEDTTINLMRLDSKNKQRHVRFDRVLVKGDAWVATDIRLLGTQPISRSLPRVFPSDHFGLWCHLESRDVGPAETVRRRGFWRLFRS